MPDNATATAVYFADGDYAIRKLDIVRLLVDRLADELDHLNEDVDIDAARKWAFLLLDEFKEIELR